MASHIHLTVSLTVQTEDDDEYIPSDCRVTDTIAMSLPSMDPKNIVFPKIVEGATVKVIERHVQKVNSYFHKKAEEERKAQERRAQLDLWGVEPLEAEDASASVEIVEATITHPDGTVEDLLAGEPKDEE